jgi:hypothetical protein
VVRSANTLFCIGRRFGATGQESHESKEIKCVKQLRTAAIMVMVCLWLFFVVSRSDQLQRVNKHFIGVAAVIRRYGLSVLEICVRCPINPLTPELSPSAQRCLTKFFTGDFAS